MEVTCESGFINSQPSMAEFMTALPHINETFHRVTSINSMQSSVQPLCQLEVSPQPAMHGPSLNASPSPTGKQHGLGSSNVAEYPWMKEKKTSRKQHQGKFCPIQFNVITTFMVIIRKGAPSKEPEGREHRHCCQSE